LKEQKIGRSRESVEDNIKTDIKAIGQEVVDWMELAQDHI
jgi:hypothetical protein